MTGFSNKFQSALFFPENESILRMPVHVINSAQADDNGQIWFVLSRPSQEINEFDREFPAKLDFFKKGKNFYIKIQGKASIVSDAKANEQDMPEQIRQQLENQRLMAIRVQVQNADYFENVPKPTSGWLQNSTSQFMNWLLNPRYDEQNPQLISIPITLQS